MTKFAEDFTDAYLLLEQAECYMTAKQIAAQLEWPAAKRRNFSRAIREEELPPGFQVTADGLRFDDPFDPVTLPVPKI